MRVKSQFFRHLTRRSDTLFQTGKSFLARHLPGHWPEQALARIKGRMGRADWKMPSGDNWAFIIFDLRDARWLIGLCVVVPGFACAIAKPAHAKSPLERRHASSGIRFRRAAQKTGNFCLTAPSSHWRVAIATKDPNEMAGDPGGSRSSPNASYSWPPAQFLQSCHHVGRKSAHSSRLLGHSRLDTTADYAHLGDEMLSDSA